MNLPSWWPWAAGAALLAVAGGSAAVVAPKSSGGGSGGGSGDGGGDSDGGKGDAVKGGAMLSAHFSRTELDPYLEATPKQLANLKKVATLILEPLRARFGAGLSITGQGGLNTASVDQWRIDHSRTLRAVTSQHRTGLAVDIRQPKTMTYSQWADFVCQAAADGILPASCGIGIYDASDGFVHVDLGGRRGKKSRKGVKHF
jgi:hypothetical protein